MLRRNALSDSTQGRLAAGATHAVGANTLMLRRLAFLTPALPPPTSVKRALPLLNLAMREWARVGMKSYRAAHVDEDWRNLADRRCACARDL
jgi:hypothetical protein